MVRVTLVLGFCVGVVGCTQISGLGGLEECEGVTCNWTSQGGTTGTGSGGDGGGASTSTTTGGGPLPGAGGISVGRYTTCVGTTGANGDGMTRCWGLMPGDGTGASRTPVVVAGIEPVAVGHGFGHNCARTANGDLYCWGNNDFGQLGDGTTTTRLVPTRVETLTNVTKVSLGAYHTCATADAKEYCWGNNAYGQVGDGTTIDRAVPTLIPALDPETVSHFGAGTFHSCAVLENPEIRCWGRNDHGQLGIDPAMVAQATVPTAPSSMFPALERVYPGARTTCGRTTNLRRLFCWGDNTFGQLGDGTTTSTFAPVEVPGIDRLGVLFPGQRHSCAYDTSDNNNPVGYCWGANDHGQLGLIGSMNFPSPQQIFEGTSDLSSKTAEHTCYVSTQGEVLCAGLNDVGQLGDGTLDSRDTFGAVGF